MKSVACGSRVGWKRTGNCKCVGGGWAKTYIPPHRKCAMEGAPGGWWWVGENRQWEVLGGQDNIAVEKQISPLRCSR
jgi:hypothetical protein